jgi:signal transduction histidine kinase
VSTLPDDPSDLVPPPAESSRRLGLTFRTRLTMALVVAAVIPLAGFGIIVTLGAGNGSGGNEAAIGRLLLLALVLAGLFGLLLAYILATDLMRPLRAISAAVDRVSAGDLSTPLEVTGDDELARLAESHNRLAADLQRRNEELGRILRAISDLSPRTGVDRLAGQAAEDARRAFEMIDAEVLLVDPRRVLVEEDVPGEPRPVRADLRAGGEVLGVLLGKLPATRTWERADQDLLELFASEVAIAIRNAQLFGRVEAQNRTLVELGAAKDDFLRGVSHNLQTPLASIRAYAEQMAAEQAADAAPVPAAAVGPTGNVEASPGAAADAPAGTPGTPDRRLLIISEQADRLSRMVRQLLTVSRLESGALKPRADVLAPAPRIRRAWEALATGRRPLAIDDRSGGWLAVADPDQLDQVLWALLDNAIKYGEGGPISVEIVTEPERQRVRITIVDSGPGIDEADRTQLFARFSRGGRGDSEDGTGLGLYVSRELCRAMGGDLVLEPAQPGAGAAFSVYVPGEAPEEA